MGTEGHVALDLDGGGTRLLMASYRVSNFGTALGTISWSGYGGASYAGWSRDFVGQSLSDVGQVGAGNSPTVSSANGTTLQRVAQRGGYTGPVDGVPGTNTWIGIQTVVSSYGYNGPIDGVPGINTYMGLQTLAQLGGYTGPVDGVLGPNTYAGLDSWLSSNPSVPSGPQGVYGIDVATTQRNLDFNAVRAAGYQYAIVKAGGTNVSPIYVAPFYQRQVAAARSAGLVVGHYWVAGSNDPVGDANFFVDHLYDYRSGDILALDNEKIDDGIFWNDSLTAQFMNTVKARLGRAPFLYTYSSLLNSISWPQTKAVGSKLWVAHYTTAGSPNIGSSFPDWAVHQYTSSGNINGVPVDINVARLSAFDGLTQPQMGVTSPPASSGGSQGSAPVTSTQDQGVILQRLAAKGGYTGPIDGDPGSNTWRGVQNQLSKLGFYDGPVDGSPGINTYRGLQLLAQAYGYEGPIDGVPGPLTYAGIAAYLDSSGGAAPVVSEGKTLQLIAGAGGYSGAVDGDPGGNTWRGIQQVLTGYGYSGPVDGQMGSNSYKGLQRLAAKGGYAGPIDGAMGANSWKGVQTIVSRFGYTGPIDGDPGTNTYIALQRMARIGGYNGPVDGAPGPNTWKGVQAILSGTGYVGPIDGVPGTNTFRALQTLAARGGYTGPIDGEPGPRTYAGLAALVEIGFISPDQSPAPGSGGWSGGGGTGGTALSATNARFFEGLRWLENTAKVYNQSHPSGPSVPQLVAGYLRLPQYGGLEWVAMGGDVPQEWQATVQNRLTAQRRGISRIYQIPEFRVASGDVDMLYCDHYFATLSAHLHEGGSPGQTRAEFSDLGGWAGDLTTTLRDWYQNANGESVASFAQRVIGRPTYLGGQTFGRTDLQQDVDAYNVARYLRADSRASIAQLTQAAFTGRLVSTENRYRTFVRLRFGSLTNARTAGRQIFAFSNDGGHTTGTFTVARTALLDPVRLSDVSKANRDALGNAWGDKLNELM